MRCQKPRRKKWVMKLRRLKKPLQKQGLSFPLPWHGGCTKDTQESVHVLWLRQLGHAKGFFHYCWIFLKVIFSKEGLGNKTGRILIWGKFRRVIQTSIPGYASYLRKKHKLVGACVQCGTSCKILFQCPAFDGDRGICTVYNDRPTVCRTFPITPADIRDRNLANSTTPCGFSFGQTPQGLTSKKESWMSK